MMGERHKLDVMGMNEVFTEYDRSYSDRWWNEEVRRSFGVTKQISEESIEIVLKWFGHTEHITEE